MPVCGKSLAVSILSIAILPICDGCVERSVAITSEPSGALVTMNDQEVGRTPLKRDFTWYGAYDMQIRKDGYQTLDQTLSIKAPVWLWPPIDFFAELWPGHLHDDRSYHFTLKPASTQPVDPDAVFSRAFEMRGMLESGPYTKPPTTETASPRPTTRATSRASETTSPSGD